MQRDLIGKLFRKKTIIKYEKKAIYSNSSLNGVSIFLLNKIFFSILIFVLSFILFDRHVSISLINTIIFNLIYNYFKYDRKINLRIKELEYDANLFFQIVLISLKSGKNLHSALDLAVNNVDNSLSKMFKDAIVEEKYGKSLPEGINDIIEKMPSENIRDILIDLKECYITGKDMIFYLEKNIKLLNNKRIYEIKAYINKLPIKISVISVFILIPLMLLLILSPVILDYFG